VFHPLFERHRALLDQALTAIAERGYWAPFPESPSPKVYGEGAADAGKAAFDALANKPFPISLPGTVGTVGGERSPYGIALGVTYPQVDLEALFAAVAIAKDSWRKAGPEAWVGVSLEILARINGRKRVMVTSTVIGGRYVIRICVVSFRTHAERMEMAIEDIRAAIAEA